MEQTTFRGAALDMSKAFDKVKHSAILRALRCRGAGEQLVAFAASMLQQSSIKLGLGSTSTMTIILDRGVLQGAPEPPLLFISVTRGAFWELEGAAAWLRRRRGVAANCRLR